MDESDAAPGEQYGAVWAEVNSGTDPSSGVVEVSRVGVRLYVSVGPGGPPAADFTIDSLSAQRATNGDPVVVASVHNTGGRALEAMLVEKGVTTAGETARWREAWRRAATRTAHGTPIEVQSEDF